MKVHFNNKFHRIIETIGERRLLRAPKMSKNNPFSEQVEDCLFNNCKMGAEHHFPLTDNRFIGGKKFKNVLCDTTRIRRSIGCMPAAHWMTYVTTVWRLYWMVSSVRILINTSIVFGMTTAVCVCMWRESIQSFRQV